MSVDVEGPQYICPACGSEDVSLIGPDDVLMVCIDCGWKDSPESFDQFDGAVSDGEEDLYEEACQQVEEERNNG